MGFASWTQLLIPACAVERSNYYTIETKHLKRSTYEWRVVWITRKHPGIIDFKYIPINKHTYTDLVLPDLVLIDLVLPVDQFVSEWLSRSNFLYWKRLIYGRHLTCKYMYMMFFYSKRRKIKFFFTPPQKKGSGIRTVAIWLPAQVSI